MLICSPIVNFCLCCLWAFPLSSCGRGARWVAFQGFGGGGGGWPWSRRVWFATRFFWNIIFGLLMCPLALIASAEGGKDSCSETFWRMLLALSFDIFPPHCNSNLLSFLLLLLEPFYVAISSTVYHLGVTLAAFSVSGCTHISNSTLSFHLFHIMALFPSRHHFYI